MENEAPAWKMWLPINLGKVIYILMYQFAVMQGPCSGIEIKGLDPATGGSVF